jgi:hypothetical protein
MVGNPNPLYSNQMNRDMARIRNNENRDRLLLQGGWYSTHPKFQPAGSFNSPLNVNGNSFYGKGNQLVGGGAGAAGTLGPVVNGIGVGGNGGNGIQSNITGTLTYRGGGGCGTGHSAGGGLPGTEGLGGGGGKNTPGAPNTGGGAGGSGNQQGGGGAGGYRCSVQGELSGQNTSAESRFKVIEQQYFVVVGNGGVGSVSGGSGIVIIRYPIYKNSIFGYPQ